MSRQMNESEREYEIVLWGATGFAGRLVAEYFADRYGASDLDWAIAGRNREKLRALRDDLAAIDPDCEALDVLVGDALDRESLDAIAERTSVVCATVGPYAKYGSNVVDACVENGTHYCDLSGEVPWMRRVIDEYHEDARENGVRIVHSCGFDSLPSDLGTLLVQQYAAEQFGATCSSVTAFVSGESFNLSGGTVASMLEVYEELDRNPDIRRLLGDPYSLTPDGQRGGPDGGSQQLPKYDGDVGQWTAPFVMAMVNEKNVHRSNALLEYPWGREFRYDEVVPTGSGPLGAVTATAAASGLTLSTVALAVSPIRRLVDRYVLPEPGDGPSRDEIEGGSFEVRLRGTGRSPGSDEEFTIEGRVTASRDPGYGATAWMLGESAVCLARDSTDTPLDGGVLTPASGIGTPLVDRLEDVGMSLTVDGLTSAATGAAE
jgi:short subunit dehydrogenase-like uncharacterized protein